MLNGGVIDAWLSATSDSAQSARIALFALLGCLVGIWRMKRVFTGSTPSGAQTNTDQDRNGADN